MSDTTTAATGSHVQLDYTRDSHFTAAGDVNDAADRVKFAYWVPNVSGGLVISKIPQRTKLVTEPS